jgi:hypothetical protein
MRSYKELIATCNSCKTAEKKIYMLGEDVIELIYCPEFNKYKSGSESCDSWRN